MLESTSCVALTDRDSKEREDVEISAQCCRYGIEPRTRLQGFSLENELFISSKYKISNFTDIYSGHLLASFRREAACLRDLVEKIAKTLVDHPEAVHVTAVEGNSTTVLELRTDPEDLGKVIGKQGRTINAMRTLLDAAGSKAHRRFKLDVVDGRVPLSRS